MFVTTSFIGAMYATKNKHLPLEDQFYGLHSNDTVFYFYDVLERGFLSDIKV